MNPLMTTNMLGGLSNNGNNDLAGSLSPEQVTDGSVFKSQFTGLWQQSAANGGNQLPASFATLHDLDPDLTQRLSELLDISEEELLSLPASFSESFLEQIKSALENNLSGGGFTNSAGFKQSELIETDSLQQTLTSIQHSIPVISQSDKQRSIELLMLNQSQNNRLTNSPSFDMQTLRQLLESVELSDKQFFKEMGTDLKALFANNDKFDQTTLSLRELPTSKALEKLVGIDRVSQHQAGLYSLSAGQVLNRSDHSIFSMPKIQVPVQHAQWGQVVGERLMFMVNDKIQVANIMINPPELGPVEVRLNLNNEQASVHFVSNHASVRDAIEEALPRLREMFSQNGLSLSDANVSQQSAQQQTKQEQASSDKSLFNEANQLPNIEQLEDTQDTRRLAIGLIDQFV